MLSMLDGWFVYICIYFYFRLDGGVPRKSQDSKMFLIHVGAKTKPTSIAAGFG